MLICIGLFMPGGLARIPYFKGVLEMFGLDNRIYRAPKVGG